MFSEETKNNLYELRQRLIYCLICYIFLFSLFFYLSHYIFNFLAEPLLKFLPKNSNLVATEILTPVVMPIKLAMNLSLFANIPFCFYQTWKFVTPGLYYDEKDISSL